MAGRLDDAYFVFVFGILHLLRSCASIDEPLHHTILHERHTPTTNSLPVERRARLQWMRNIVGDVNVLAKKFRADTVIQKRPLIENRQAAEIEEHEAGHIQHGCWLKNNGVLAGRNLFRICRFNRLLGSNLGQRLRIKIADVRRIRFLPSG